MKNDKCFFHVEDPLAMGILCVCFGIIFLIISVLTIIPNVTISVTFGGALLLTGVFNLIKYYKPELHKKIMRTIKRKNPSN